MSSTITILIEEFLNSEHGWYPEYCAFQKKEIFKKQYGRLDYFAFKNTEELINTLNEIHTHYGLRYFGKSRDLRFLLLQ